MRYLDLELHWKANHVIDRGKVNFRGQDVRKDNLNILNSLGMLKLEERCQ